MATPILEVRLPIQLDRERTMIFNGHMMQKFEEVAGNPNGDEPPRYWAVMIRLMQYYEDHADEIAELWRKDAPITAKLLQRRMLMVPKIMRYISSKDLQLLLWCSLIEYKGKKPTWPLDIDDLARMIRPNQTLEIVNKLLEGHRANNPTAEELGEASGDGEATKPSEAAQSQPESGGEATIALPASVLA